ncbi:MAG: hypothetical protein B7C24_00750 [Bacteroidetes bacterium 4572_77]|nr:MAG: hypothetical protein B7C24_00750 [Bacteroidetes bacterium 4572_77]
MNRSKLALLGIFILLITVLSCNKIKDLLTFTVNDTSELVIESNLLPFSLPFEIWTPPITTNSNEEFANNNTKSSLVKDVYITHLDIKIISPEDKTFSFLKSMIIYISTNDDNEIELARKEDISSDTKTLNMEITDKRLDTYIKADSYRLRTQVTTKETLTQDITVEVDMSFKVTADPL